MLFSFSCTGDVECEWFENLLPTGDDSAGLSGMTSSKSQSSKSWKPCTAAGVVLTGFKGAGKSPRDASDFEAEMSSSKSFCEYEPVKLFPLVDTRPKDCAFLSFEALPPIGSGKADAFVCELAPDRFFFFFLPFLPLKLAF